MGAGELVDFFRDGMNQGVSIIELKGRLLDNGWPPEEVKKAMNIALGRPRGNRDGFLVGWGGGRFLLLFLCFAVLIASTVVWAFTIQGGYISGINSEKGVYVDVGRNAVLVQVDGSEAEISLEEASEYSASFMVEGKSMKVNLGESRPVDLDGDSIFDAFVRVEKILDGFAKLYVESLD